MKKDSPDMPRNLGFRSDIRRKVSYRDLAHIYGASPREDSTNTAAIGLAVLRQIARGAKLAFPGHILNAGDYVLIMEEKYISIPSRVPQWLYDNELVDARGMITKVGQIKAQEIMAH